MSGSSNGPREEPGLAVHFWKEITMPRTKVTPSGPHAERSPDKATVKTRIDCSTLIGQKAPKSSIVTSAEKLAVTSEDLSNLGLHPLNRNKFVFGEPLAVDLKYDRVLHLIRIHVKLPPGMDACEIEVSPDPVTATSWKRLVGHGVKREIQNPSPGTYWVHAATVRATEQSTFTVPVSIIVT
jgi:hypothetical protein